MVAAAMATAIVGASLLAWGALTASAQGEGDSAKSHPTTVAIAIGQVIEADGEGCIIDLLAFTREGRTGGALRFFDEHAGYYNGAVRTLTVEGSTIYVSGGGGLLRPDGHRVRVEYTATIDTESGATTIEVVGTDYAYTMSGVLDGFATIHSRPARAALAP